jgi:hypothetical protein
MLLVVRHHDYTPSLQRLKSNRRCGRCGRWSVGTCDFTISWGSVEPCKVTFKHPNEGANNRLRERTRLQTSLERWLRMSRVAKVDTKM